MKHTIAMGLAALSLVVISGCSSMQDKSTMAKSVEVDDAAYIARVERVAMDRGVMVRWVNPPKKRVDTQL
ncbi:hypothetical protein [Cognatiluteimonas profundi]|uniref:hypothetical protein n=1 Tax=Cognatiluteimonas profundi TaxID=2594501 RepID=UPI00131BD32F|nr:hypothetical protein [Lysobacter profundi]